MRTADRWHSTSTPLAGAALEPGKWIAILIRLVRVGWSACGRCFLGRRLRCGGCRSSHLRLDPAHIAAQ